MEGTEKAGVVVEATLESDAGEGLAGADHLLGAEDAAVENVIIDTPASVGGKLPGHVGRADAELAGQLLDGNWFLKMLIDIGKNRLDGFIQDHWMIGSIGGLGQVIHIGQELGHPKMILPLADFTLICHVLPNVHNNGLELFRVFLTDGEIGPIRLNTFFEIVVQIRGAPGGLLEHDGGDVKPGPFIRGIRLSTDEAVHVERRDNHQGAWLQGRDLAAQAVVGHPGEKDNKLIEVMAVKPLVSREGRNAGEGFKVRAEFTHGGIGG